MSEKLELYKCNVCGNIIEIIHPGQGQLVCCSLPMEQLKEHYIVFIEAISPDKKYLKRKYLSPNEEPRLDIKQCCHYNGFTARELCNIHGLWVSENK